jgi:microcystin-dependent protein
MVEGAIGEIRLFAGGYAPRHWAFCDGHILNIHSNTALFSILGTSFGGDGINTFALPNLDGPPQPEAGRQNVRYIICVEGQWPARPD